jgi:hypothetical protein
MYESLDVGIHLGVLLLCKYSNFQLDSSMCVREGKVVHLTDFRFYIQRNYLFLEAGQDQD